MICQQRWGGMMYPELDDVSISPNPHLPPHLREICDILARGLLRLRSRGMLAGDRKTGQGGDIHLHFRARQRLHANPKREEIA